MKQAKTSVPSSNKFEKPEQIGNLELLKKGFNFLFQVDGKEVLAQASSKWTTEKIYLDKKLVSKRHSMRIHSVHHFAIGGTSYEVEFHSPSRLTGEVHCSLIKEGVHIETQKQVSNITATKRKAWFTWITSYLTGILVLVLIVSLIELVSQ